MQQSRISELVMFAVALTTLATTMATPSGTPLVHQHRVDLEHMWAKFKAVHGKQYDNAKEESYRRAIWEQNIDFIQKHNIEADLGLHTFTVGVNQYADLNLKEYGQMLLGDRYTPVVNRTDGDADDDFDDSGLPSAVDWRKAGAVTPVQDQGVCGACWAFAATGALEGQWFIKQKKLVKLSEQNLIDCTLELGNFGCNGGTKVNAFYYIQTNGGIDTAASYPYQGKGGQCRYNSANVGAKCRGYKPTRSVNEKALRLAVAQVGPVAVSIDAYHSSFQFYKSGIYNNPSCTTETSHSLLVVGYGIQGDDDYWIVKNSWGTSWGDAGYVLMSRNRNNQCGIGLFAYYPVV